MKQAVARLVVDSGKERGQTEIVIVGPLIRLRSSVCSSSEPHIIPLSIASKGQLLAQ